MTMNHNMFFGYGSLVNRATQGYPGIRRATVTGWRRAWRHTGTRDVAFLTAVPAPGARLDGLLAEVPGGDWAALDTREWAYVRTQAEPDRAAQIYHIPADLHAAPTTQHPILLSYLDVVVQGYLAEFGPQGVARFFATTDGWDAPILNDRAAPRYPRAQPLSAEETALVDAMLSGVGAKET
jgi:hypothetical protein